MKPIAAVLLVVLSPALFAKGRVVRSVQMGWGVPQCEATGIAQLRYVDLNGVVHTSAADPAPNDRSRPTTLAIEAGAARGTLWALDSDGTIHRSADAGCTFDVVAAVPEALARQFDAGIVARHESHVYVYTAGRYLPRTTWLVRLTGGTVEKFVIPDPQGFIALDVDRADALHLRAIGKLGTAWNSIDGGASWTVAGGAGGFPTEALSAAFHPQNLDVILVGTKSTGLWKTLDGGVTWSRTAIASGDVEGVRFSPADANVIYAGVVPSELRRSVDGGQTFTSVDFSRNPPWARLFYMDRVFALHPTDPLTSASGGERAVGVRVIHGDGRRIAWATSENVAEVEWAPSGVLYYLRLVVEPR